MIHMQEDEFDKIQDALTHGGVALIATDSELETTNAERGLNGEKLKSGMVLGHQYSIVDTKIENNIRYVKIRNPWGCSIPAFDKDEKGNLRVMMDDTSKTNGETWMEWNNILACTYRTDISGTV